MKGKNKKARNPKSYIVATIISILWVGIHYYINFPAINVQNRDFWAWLLVQSVVVSCFFFFRGII